MTTPGADTRTPHEPSRPMTDRAASSRAAKAKCATIHSCTALRSYGKLSRVTLTGIYQYRFHVQQPVAPGLRLHAQAALPHLAWRRRERRLELRQPAARDGRPQRRLRPRCSRRGGLGRGGGRLRFQRLRDTEASGSRGRVKVYFRCGLLSHNKYEHHQPTITCRHTLHLLPRKVHHRLACVYRRAFPQDPHSPTACCTSTSIAIGL